MKPFMWLSATWCTTWRTVQPSGRYGVSSCRSSGRRRRRESSRAARRCRRCAAARRRRGGRRPRRERGRRVSAGRPSVSHALALSPRRLRLHTDFIGVASPQYNPSTTSMDVNRRLRATGDAARTGARPHVSGLARGADARRLLAVEPAQLRTPWGREHLERFALVDDAGRARGVAQALPLSNAPRRPRRLDVRHRRRVHAAGLARARPRRARSSSRCWSSAQREGALVAGLFSEIGAAFYERLGFSRCRSTR